MLIKLTNCFSHFRYDAKEDKLKPSTFQFKIEELNFLKLIILKTFKLLHLVQVTQHQDGTCECSNFTIINCTLVIFAKINEKDLTIKLLRIQILGSFIAVFICYVVSRWFY